MSGLGGARVAILEARLGGELAELVRRRGGEPVCAPAVVEERTDARAELEALLEAFSGVVDPLFVFTTGAGVAALFAEARAASRTDELRALLSRSTLASRGPKPAAALAREGLGATVRAPEPYTEAELLAVLGELPLAGQPTALVHHGERSASLATALTERGARVQELLLYAWRMPGDRGPLRSLVEELEGGRIDAVLFTSQVQARHLFAVARELGREEELRTALGDAVVASIGPTCTSALLALGIAPAVVPERPKMGALVAALEKHLSNARSTAWTPNAPGPDTSPR